MGDFDKAEAMMKLYTSKFSISSISAEEIHALRDRSEQERVLLVDVRSHDEWETSHCNGAIRLADFEREFAHILEESRKGLATVIPYCTIGYRSGLFAENLVSRGFPPDRVRNGGS
jgi:rhodanese-related sulfurtransferase